MKRDRNLSASIWAAVLFLLMGHPLVTGQAPAPPQAQSASQPAKIYVPYEKLKGVFETEKQGVFLPYGDFQRLWVAAKGAPAEVQEAPVPYLISTARFQGKVDGELAVMQLELTVDILSDAWVQVPIGLGEVAVSGVAFAPGGDEKTQPLLRVVEGRYLLVTKGRGRRVLKVDFVRQLVTQPGLNVLGYRMPSAAISTLELLIPEENLKVDVTPMLAATTTQVSVEDKKATRLQAFLGSADAVQLSWKPKTQAAAELEPVVIGEQLQTINVAEALISHEVKFTYDIRRRGVDTFTIQLPAGFRVTGVDGADISRWDLPAGEAAKADQPQVLTVKLFSPAKDRYELTVRMERFLKESEAVIPLTPIVTQQVLRRTGLIAVIHSSRRSVELRVPKNLARVDTGRLPENLQKQPGVMAYRFITADYGAALAIGTVLPRISVTHSWVLGVDSERMDLFGRLNYNVERSGVFEVKMNLPEPWQVVSVGPANVVDDHQLSGAGAARTLNILLKKELTGGFTIDLVARSPRAAADANVELALPLCDAANLQLYSGQVVLFLAARLRAEVAQLDQLRSLPLGRAPTWTSVTGLSPAMAFEFQAIDRAKPAGAAFRIALKPAQVSAVVHRLVNVQAGRIEEEAVIQYQVLYAPVDTFYLKLPAAMGDEGVDIQGNDIKEKPRIDKLPDEATTKPATTPEKARSEESANRKWVFTDGRWVSVAQGPPASAARPAAANPAPTPSPNAIEAASQKAPQWAYYKVVLQSPVMGTYTLTVRSGRAFQAGEVGKETTVVVGPILAAGKLSDQSGYIAVAKADTLAVVDPVARNLIPADPTSPADLPWEPHRRIASLAFKYNNPPFELALSVVTQKEAAVITTIATAAVIEQVIARDGTLNAHTAYLLATSRGDRLSITLPKGSKLFSVLLNGVEAPVEMGPPNPRGEQRIVRLPPSAGQVSKVVLEVFYGLDKASAGSLGAPILPEDIPVQQTLWRLWVSDEEYVVAFDDIFARLRRSQAEDMLRTLSSGQPTPVTWKLAAQGREWDFIRQGAPGELSVTLAGKEIFNILLWAVVLAAGAAMLKLKGFHRCLAVLGVVLLCGVVWLFAPLLVKKVVECGLLPAAIVAGLWLAWWFSTWLKRRRASRPQPPPAPKEPARAAT